MIKHLCLLFFIFSFTIESEASSASRRRRRQINAYIQKVSQECLDLKTNLYSMTFECPIDSSKLIKDDYLHYLTNNKEYNTCVYSTKGDIKDRAYSDVSKDVCMTKAEKENKELVQEIVKKHTEDTNREQLKNWTITVVLVSFALLLTFYLI